jgi:hypothetical protein
VQKGILAITKKSFCLTLLMLVSFVMSLPRAQETLVPTASSLALVGHLSHVSSLLVPAPSQKSGPEGLDVRLFKVRKFRRRRTSFTFNTHLSVAFLSDPSARASILCLPVDDPLLSREPDPLVHPPA